MTRRRYRLGKRAEAAADTRRRIVEATLALHDQQGITGTSLRDIAEGASVAPSTVLQHFPRMDELIGACGELSNQLAPMPTEGILAGLTDEGQRIHRLAVALFEWWEQLGPGWDHLRIDRRRVPQVDTWLIDVARRHRDLVAAALGRPDDSRLDVLVAVTTADAWHALRDAGMDPRHAAAQVAGLIGQDQHSTRLH